MIKTLKEEKNSAFREICKLAGRAVGQYKMITGGERILVGLSGGKDSMTLAHVLIYIQRRSPIKFELFFATFNPQFPDFGMEKLRQYCQKQEWVLNEISMDMPKMVAERPDKSPCMICSRMRRGHLYTLAKELQCTHLALGQHLDDIESSFLMSLARGQGLTTMGPNVSSSQDVRVIRPLAFVPESLIRESAQEFDFPVGVGKCSFANELDKNGDRAYFMELLNVLEERIPHVRSNILKSLNNIQLEYLLDLKYLYLEN